jgi:peptidoglycan hydrolase-like protein with peptidoglycan-binding domain
MPFDQPELQSGDEGDAVARLQEDLVAVGLYFDSVDGFFGDSTQAAVLAFQEAMDLDPDGMVTFDTWAALEGPESTEEQSYDLGHFPAMSLRCRKVTSPMSTPISLTSAALP